MKHFYNFRKSTFSFLVFALTFFAFSTFTSLESKAQTTITTTFTNNNGFACVTFNFQNTNATAVTITDIASVCGVAGPQNVSAWFKPSAINGSPGNISAANGWTQFGSATITGIANTTTSTPQPFMSGLNLSIPAGATYGIAVSATNLRYSSLVAGLYTIPGGGCNIITGTDIGFGGDAPPATPGNNNRGFIGSVTFISSVACSGTPAPGNTVSTANPVCSGVPFTLSPQNNTSGTGVTYQWQSSPNNTTYTDIGGATSSNLTTSQTTATWYKLRVTCGAGSAFTNALNVTMAAPTACYCAAGATSTGFEKISNVTFNTINNPSTSTAGYENFTAITTNVNPGQTLPITVALSAGFATDVVIVFIDFNQDGDFTDAGETVYTSSAGIGPHTGSITIPAGATAGNTRMRVRMHDSDPTAGPNATSCGTSTYGQVEDYTLNIGSSTACSGTPAPGNTLSTVVAPCPAQSFTLSPQNATSGTGVTYQWQSSPNGTTYTDIGGATSSIYTTSQTAATYYKVRVTCGANSTFSNALLVNMALPTACYCAAGATSTGFEKIANVVFNTINNPSTSTAGYENFTAITSNVASGSSYPITVTINASAWVTDQVIVWIDFNQDGDFTDAGETVYTSAIGVGPHTGSIAIPASALAGNTRMRIRLHDTDPTASPNATPCGNSTYGQVEDYTLNISCVAGVTTQPLSATASCGATVVLTAAGSGNPTFQWQVSTNGGGSWTNLTNTAPYSGVTTNQLTITGVTGTLNSYQYRVVLSNACTSGLNSNAATLTVNTPATPTLTPSTPVVCLGGIAQLNLTSPAVPGGSNVITTETGTGFTNLGITGGDVAVTFGVQNSTGTARTLTSIDMAWNTFYTVGPAVATLWVTTTSLGGAPTIAAPAWTQIATANMNITTNGIQPTFTGMSYVLASNTSYRFAVRSTNGINYSPAASTPNTFTIGGISLLVNNAAAVGGNVGYAGAFPSPANTPRAFQGRITVTSPPVPGAPQAGIFTPNTGLFTDPGGLNAYNGTSVSTIYAKPNATTNYSVSAGVTGCLSPAVSFQVRVNQPANFTTQPSAVAVCENGSATFAGVATGTAPVTLQWQVSTDAGATWTNIASATTGSLTLTNITNAMNGNRYRLAATSAAPCGPTFSTAVALTVRPLPVVSLTANPGTKIIPTVSTTLTANVTGATPASFRWFRNGTQVTGATGSTLLVNIDQLGDYTASVTDVNGCVSLISPLLKISDSATGRVFLYPNPNLGKFKIRFYTEFFSTLPGGQVTNSLVRYLEVYNAQGQKIMDKPFSVTAPYAAMDVDLSPWGSGTYWIEIKDVSGKRLVVGRAVVL